MQHCRDATVVDRKDGMARKLTPRSRGRLAKASSFSQKGQRRFGTFLAAGGFLLLACVLFLEVRLSGVKSYEEDASGNQEENYLNTGVHREHVDFQKRFFEGELAGHSISAGRRMEEEVVQKEQVKSNGQLGEEGLDDVDELEREVQGVSLDTSTRAALLRRNADRDRLDLGSRKLDIDESKLEDLEAELDMENDELEEFESFGGNFLNELDELKDEKPEDMDDSDFGNENEESTAGTLNKSGAKEEENAGELQNKSGGRAGVQIEQGGGDRLHAEVLREELREMEERERGDDDDSSITSQGGKRLERLGHIKTLPRSEKLPKATSTGRKLGVAGKSAFSGLSLRGYVEREADTTHPARNEDKRRFWWDHVLGVSKEPLYEADKKPSSTDVDSPKTSSKEVFSTDDEPLDEALRSKVEQMVEIEDAFLLKSPKLFKTPKNSKIRTLDSDAGRKEGAGRVAIDLLNPANNPLLTDPDSLDTGGLTKDDKVILHALRRVSLDDDQKFEDQSTLQVPAKKPLEAKLNMALDTQEKIALRKTNLAGETDVGLRDASAVLIPESRGALPGEDDIEQRQRPLSGAERAILLYHATESPKLLSDSVELLAKQKDPFLQRESRKLDRVASSVFSSTVARDQNERTLGVSASRIKQDAVLSSLNSAIPPASHRLLRGSSLHKRQDVKVGGRWGKFPGIDPSLSFTGFMDQFLASDLCTLRVFMVWTTLPWSYTVRYQRGLESLLHFHPQACVVVFSDVVDTDFFDGFVQDGYRVAVVNPNLEELLEDTPSDVFASVWKRWRKRSLYYIHYSELLRLAALYRYGGLYLDSDVVVLKPLTDLRNTLGAISEETGVPRLSGAIMAFDKASPFLKECLKEFTATYDDKRLGWNGGGLLTRVAKRYQGADVDIQPPSAFYPLQSSGIQRYFAAPRSSAEQRRHSDLLERILRESYTLHFWNSLTARVIPERGSLVAKILDQHCLRCDEAV